MRCGHTWRLLIILLFLNACPSVATELIAAIGASCCILFGACLPACVTPVSTGHEALVERFGRFNRRLTPGWHFLYTPIEQISMKGSLREQVLDIPKQACYTKDNAPISADAIVYMQIFDMEAACYKVEGVYQAIRQLCLTQLREEIGKLTLDEAFSSREILSKSLLQDLNEVTQKWGVRITRVELQELQPSSTISAGNVRNDVHDASGLLGRHTRIWRAQSL